MKSIRFKGWLFILILIVIAILTFLYALSSGEVHVPWKQMPSMLFAHKGNMDFTIIHLIRLPRIILGMAVGGSLSLAGVILQGIYRNPLVEPYTLGISGGAAMGVGISIVLGLHLLFGSEFLTLAGLGGALGTTILVYFLSLRKGKIVIHKMVLMGVMISFIASSAMMFLFAISRADTLHNILFWIMGSLDVSDIRMVRLIVIVSLICLLASYLMVRPLNALRLGEESAGHLGVNTDLAIKILFFITSLLTGLCVAVAGIIAFVGLVIPQLIRLLVGSDNRILLISSYLLGGSFLVFCDTLARTIVSPSELPVGVITGMIGGVVFILVLSRSKSTSGFLK